MKIHLANFLSWILLLNYVEQASSAVVGKTHIYTYRAQVTTGISHVHVNQAAGFAIQATLKTHHTQTRTSFQLSNITWVPFNRRVQEEFFEFFNLNYEPAHENGFLQEMEKPFWIEFHQGLVTLTEFPFGSWEKTANMKKAIASLFQVNLSQRKNNDTRFYYTVEEDSIVGRCPTIYRGEEINSTEIKLTKMIQYDQCRFSPHKFFASVDGEKCGNCSMNLLETFGHVDYYLTVNNQSYSIEHIESHSVKTFAPFTTFGQRVLSVTNQSIILINSVDEDDPLEAEDNLTDMPSLHFQFPHDDLHNLFPVDLTQTHYFDRVHWVPHNSSFGQIGDILSQIERESGLQPESAIKLIEVMTSFEYDDFVQLFDKTDKIHKPKTNGEKELRFILLEVLPFVGTNPAVIFALNIIKHKSESKLNCIQLLDQMAFHVKEPSDQLLENYFEFLQSIDDSDHQLISTAWTTFGTLLYRGCRNGVFNPRPKLLPTFMNPETCSFHLDNIIDKFHDSSDERAEMLLHSICNTRFPDTLQLLTNVATGNYSPALRQIAIRGLQNLIPYKATEIVLVLLRIFKNNQEDGFLRILAFDVLLHIPPKPQFLTDIVLHLEKATDPKVTSYVHSTLVNLANSSNPCHYILSKQAQEALKHTDPQRLTLFTHPVNKMVSFFNDKHNFGGSVQFISIPSNVTLLPSEIYLRHSFNLLGYNFDFSEFEFRQSNFTHIDLLLATLLGKYGFGEKSFISDHTAKSEFHNHLLKLLDSMKKREFRKESDGDFLKISKKVFNQNIFFGSLVDFDPIRHVTAKESENGKTNLAIRYNKLIYINVEYIIPNDMGFPLTLELKIPIILKVRGSLTVDPRNGHKILLWGIPSSAGLNLDLSLGVDFAIHSRTFVDFSFHQSFGYWLVNRGTFQLPLQVTTDYDLISHQLDLTHAPSTHKNFIFYKSTPMTFNGSDNPLPIIFDDPAALPHMKLHRIGHNYCGCGVTFNLSHDSYWNGYFSYSNLVGSLTKKSSEIGEGNSYLADRWYAGTRGFIDFLIINPTARPFTFQVHYEPSNSNPTTEMIVSLRKSTHKYYDDGKERKERWSFTKYDLEVVANGRLEKKWHVELHYSAQSPPQHWKRVRLHVQRTSLPGYDDEPSEFCLLYNLQSFYSKLFVDPLNVEQDPPSMRFQIALTFGKNCQNTKDSVRITVNGDVIKTEEQFGLNRQLLPFYKKCREDWDDGFELSPQCWNVKKDFGRLNQLIADVEYNGFTSQMYDFFYRARLWKQNLLYDNIHLDESDGNHRVKKNNHLKVMANVSYHRPVIDIRVTKTTSYKNIFIPSVFPGFEVPSVAEPYSQILSRNFFNYLKPMCFLSGNYIRTIDDGIFQYNLTNCYHLVLGDCHTRRIFLLMRRFNHKKFTKSLLIFLDEDMIEIKPGTSDLLVVYVNQKPIKARQYVKQKDKTDTTVDDKETYTIYRYWNGLRVDSNFYDLTVFFDGRNARIVVSDFLRGRQCGLCGNMDGKLNSHLIGMNGTLHTNSTEFASSYAIKYKTC